MTDVHALVRETINRHPDNTNPFSCLYTDPDLVTDPELDYDAEVGHHCLVGQVAVDNGWICPGPDEHPDLNSEVVSVVAPRLGWPLTAEEAMELEGYQEIADYRAGTPWRDLPL